MNGTSFATDALNPVQGSDISRLLSTDHKQPVIWTTVEELHASPKKGIYVYDGETDSDLEVAARKFARSTSFPFVARPTGFVEHIARLIDLPRTTPESPPRLRSILHVNGSRSEVSIRQIQHTGERDCTAMNAGTAVDMEEKPSWLILNQPITVCSPVDFARIPSHAVRDISRPEKFDTVVCMYHNQGHIPSKLLV